MERANSFFSSAPWVSGGLMGGPWGWHCRCDSSECQCSRVHPGAEPRVAPWRCLQRVHQRCPHAAPGGCPRDWYNCWFSSGVHSCPLFTLVAAASAKSYPAPEPQTQHRGIPGSHDAVKLPCKCNVQHTIKTPRNFLLIPWSCKFCTALLLCDFMIFPK